MSANSDNVTRLPVGPARRMQQGEPLSVANLTESGGGGGPMDPKEYVTRETMALTVDAIRSQIDAKFAEFSGKVSSRNDVIGAALAIAALIIGLAAFGGDRFDGGVQVSSAVSQMSAENQAIAKSNADAITALAAQVRSKDEQISALITALELQAEKNAKEDP